MSLKDNPHGKYSVEIKYKIGDDPRNMQLKKTWRATRSIAVIHKEGEVEIVDLLNEAAKRADIHHITTGKEPAVAPWGWTTGSFAHDEQNTWAKEFLESVKPKED